MSPRPSRKQPPRIKKFKQLSATPKLRQVQFGEIQSGLCMRDTPAHEPKGWRTLWLKTQKEKDPKKLIELIDQLNELLTEREKKAAAEAQSAPASSRDLQSSAT
jgi:hypothetical protein